MRRDFWQDNRDFFKRFEDQFKALESESRFSKESAGSNEIMNYNRNAGSSALDFDEDFGSFWPRRWLMPRGFFDSEFDSKFEVSVDTHGYKPEDLQVRIKDNMVTIEA